MEELVDFCLNNIPQMHPLMENQEKFDRMSWDGRQHLHLPRLAIRQSPEYRPSSIDFSFHDIPYEQMVRHFAGPIYRMYGCPWKFIVGGRDRITLRGSIQVWGYGEPIHLDLDCYLTNVEKCVIVTDEEPRTYLSTSYRIKCS